MISPCQVRIRPCPNTRRNLIVIFIVAIVVIISQHYSKIVNGNTTHIVAAMAGGEMELGAQVSPEVIGPA